MLRYIMKRLLMMIPVLLGVSFIVFSMIYFTPGDPAEYMLGMDATPAGVASLRAELGLDKPFLVQYFNYIKNIVVQRFRHFVHQPADRWTDNSERAADHSTSRCSVRLAKIMGYTLIAATKQYSVFDHIATIFALTGVSMPNFWTGLMLIIVFSVYLGWFPSSGFSRPIQWVLPAVTVGLASTANIMRQTRSSMLEVIRQDYINTARAKGQKESKVIFKHALKNALIPVVTVIGISFGGMLGGAILAESIFSIPGIGKLMIDSINVKNYPMVQGGVLFIAFGFSVVNLLVDILYAFIDPRIKSQYRRTKKSSVVSLAKSKA